jgi:cellulose synthase/poly-beta-1,6-N-acetylglucosamine synthase-like glycosyltransferase
MVTYIIVMSMINLVRMTLYLIGSDIYALKQLKTTKANRRNYYRPTVSLVVPAHNEAALIEKTLECLARLDYPKNKLQIIIANDGSTDGTSKIVQKFIKRHKGEINMVLFGQRNGGKANVLNNAIRRLATGTFIMCLDADSLIAPDAIKKAVYHFRDKRVVAIASNVNIIENGTILGLAQRFEYLISYHMKKAQTIYNIEYIIGGIGSMFRRSVLEKVQYYDTNTMTEDIDLTMKIIAQGNKQHRIAYASDCITYTEAVPSIKSLVKQRFRWKYGRLQTFYKNYKMFFARDSIYSKTLTWLMLPYALLLEMLFLLEPLIVTLIIFTSIYYHSPGTILAALAVVSIYILINVWSSGHLTFKEKLRLSFFTPSMYVVMYLMSIVEYIALIQSISKLPALTKSLSSKRTTWVSPERSGASLTT